MNLIRAAAASAIFATEATAVLMQKHTLSMQGGARVHTTCGKSKAAGKTTPKPVPKDDTTCKAYCTNTRQEYMLDDSKDMNDPTDPTCSDVLTTAFGEGSWDGTTGTCKCKTWENGSCGKEIIVCGSSTMGECGDDIKKAADEAAQKKACAKALGVDEAKMTFTAPTKDATGKCMITDEGDWAPACTLPKKVETPLAVSPVCDKPAEMTKEKCEKEECKEPRGGLKEYTAPEKEKEGSCVCNKAKDEAKPETNKCTIPKGTEIAEPKGKDDGSSGSF